MLLTVADSDISSHSPNPPYLLPLSLSLCLFGRHECGHCSLSRARARTHTHTHTHAGTQARMHTHTHTRAPPQPPHPPPPPKHYKKVVIWSGTWQNNELSGPPCAPVAGVPGTQTTTPCQLATNRLRSGYLLLC